MEGLIAWLEGVQGMITRISGAVFLVCIAGAALMFALSGGKEPQGAKKWVFNIFIAIAIASFGTTIVTALM